MDTNTIIIIAVLVTLALIVVALIVRKSRSANLQRHFGPEYVRAVEETGDRRQAEAELHDREKRMKAFSIRPLSPKDRERYAVSWRSVQAEFVDNPKVAVARADQLVEDVMSARGYPVTDFDQVAADLSVDHPVVVQNYRAAHEIVRRRDRGVTATEDLRQAMVHYRTLFDELVGRSSGGPAQAAS